ncbi:MAG: hypothetical protein JWN24_2995 [Phycisphaerales bacterium]|nr:hypothetical protein [Phycisphaerales bacterium]
MTDLARYHPDMYQWKIAALLALLILSARAGYYLHGRVSYYGWESKGPYIGIVGRLSFTAVTSAEAVEAKRKLPFFVAAMWVDGVFGLVCLVGIFVLWAKARKSRQRGFPIEPRRGT